MGEWVPMPAPHVGPWVRRPPLNHSVSRCEHLPSSRRPGPDPFTATCRNGGYGPFGLECPASFCSVDVSWLHGCMRARVAVAGLVAMAGLWLGATPAGGHADLIFSCPGAGELISDLPEVQLRFDGPLDVSDATPALITLESRSDGRAPALGPVELVGVNALVADIRGPIPAGNYTATYEVISADGDTNVGAVDFTFAGGDGGATNCIESPGEGEDGGGVGAVVMIVAPLVVLGLALFGFNRWAADRSADPV